MATRLHRKKHNPYESLERILNKTTLTTQRVCHGHIIEIGNGLMSRTHEDIGNDKDQAIADALRDAEERHKEEVAAAVNDLKKQLESDREQALLSQKQYFESVAAKALEQWEKAEAEKMRLLKKQYKTLLDEALKSQADEFEDYKQKAINEACRQLERKMRNEFVHEREHAIADALGKARKKFREREQEVIKQTKAECKKQMDEEVSRLEAQHQEELEAVISKYNTLQEKFNQLLKDNEKVEADFKELQRDYMRFLDNTGGRYHSDYMIIPRSHPSLITADGLSLNKTPLPSTTTVASQQRS